LGLSAGTRLGPYEVLAPIGAGGMGEVYKARDTRLDRTVAVKVLPEELTSDSDRRARFEREARAASALNHPHICTLYDIGERSGQPFLVMELLTGQTLRQRIQAGVIGTEEVLRLGLQVADALATAHAVGIIHRDIKPANIHITERGDAKVLDFGLAKLIQPNADLDWDPEAPTREKEDLTTPGTTAGTLYYMSPEQVLGRPVDARTDVFSLGVVLYEMATGRRPFQGEGAGAVTDKILHDDPNPVLRVKPGLPAQLDGIIGKCLEKDPQKRYRSEDLRRDLESCLELIRGEQARLRPIVYRWARRPLTWTALAAVALASTAGAVRIARQKNAARHAREVMLPKLRQLVEEGWHGNVEAYRLAREAERHVAGDAELAQLLSKVATETTLLSDPPGATVYVKPYEDPGGAWERIGLTPIARHRGPSAFLRWKVEKQGYETVIQVLESGRYDWEKSVILPGELKWRLDRVGAIPADMVRVQGAPEAPLPDYLIDRHEVTNRQFKAFVEASGYQNRAYWKVDFVREGRTIPWQEAVKEFVDRTGRPGPSTWEAGDFPKGQDEFPVSGVSWYEAAAYAEYAGKSLPTLRHWLVATGRYVGTTNYIFPRLLLPLSNFRSEGPVRVGSSEAITPFGVADMAGNVREWCWNETKEGRSLRGGAWNDHTYMYGNITQAPAFDRSERNGFRCVQYLDARAVPREAFDAYAPRPDTARKLLEETPVPDAVFTAYRERFSYDPTNLKAAVEARVESKGWVREKVSFDAAYGGERMTAQLFLPRTPPPHQVVLYFPGSSAQTAVSSDRMEESFEFDYNLSFLMKTGRAVLYPIYKATYERKAKIPRCQETHEVSEHRIQLVKDARRSLDYIALRSDLDRDRIAFFGWSWGGRMANLVLAVEPRIKAAVVSAGGLWATCRTRPEVDGLNFTPRITTPTLMLHGRYDMAIPLDAEAKPMFELLGTPSADKVLKVYDTDHFIERKELIKESLAWLDKYLGPVSSTR
jgi:dienelactone hydrolase